MELYNRPSIQRRKGLGTYPNTTPVEVLRSRWVKIPKTTKFRKVLRVKLPGGQVGWIEERDNLRLVQCRCKTPCPGYECQGCGRTVPWCFGAADDMPDHCDDCWAEANKDDECVRKAT